MVKLEESKYEEKKIVVFCVDGTAGLAPYWKQMKRNYIRPSIQALQDLKNIESGQYSSTCFATVVYGAGDGFGGPYHCIKEFEDTLLPKVVLEDFEKLELHGGGFERRTHLVEALSVALTILGTSTAPEKHIVIITNSDFYDTKVHNINNDYYKQSLEQLVQASVAFQAKVSVIAPRVINSLKSLFNSTNFEGAPSQGNKIDGHHMILTHFVMENQPDPPQSIESQRQAAATPQKEEVKAEIKTEPSSEPVPQIQTVQNPTQMMQTTQDPPKSMAFNQGQIHKPVMSQAGGIPPNPAQTAGQINQQPQQMQGQQQNAQPQISKPQTGHPGQQVNHQQNPQQHQMNPSQQQAQQQQTPQQKKIWTGELRWVDPGSESNQERRIGCSLSAQSQPEVGEEFLRGCPPLLKVNFIEQPMIQAVKGFFQNSTVLVFNWNENPVPAVNRETLGNLHSIMTQKNQVGVINVSQNQGQGPPKMLVMVFNAKNRSFLALIPNDPEGFFTKLKEIYQIQKRPGQEGVKQQNPQQQQQQQQQQNPQVSQQQQNPQQQMNQHQMNQANMQRPMVSMPMNTQMQGIMPMRGVVPNSMGAARQMNPGQPVMGMQNYMQRPQGQQPMDQQHHQQQQNPQQMQQFQMQQMQQQNQRQNFNPTQNNEQLRHLLIQNNSRNPQINQNQGYGNQGF